MRERGGDSGSEGNRVNGERERPRQRGDQGRVRVTTKREWGKGEIYVEKTSREGIREGKQKKGKESLRRLRRSHRSRQ